jgi:hypothetical protein
MPRRSSKRRAPNYGKPDAENPEWTAEDFAKARPLSQVLTELRDQKKRGTDHDFAVNAFRVVEQAIGEKMDGSPLPDPHAGKNPHAVALGKLGGAKGGKARADALSPAKRKQIAKAAAKARWAKPE